MARYIDADIAEMIIAEKAKEPDYQHEGDDWRLGLCMAETAIEETPTADVVPKSEVDSEIKVWQELYADTVSKWEKAYEELEIKLENAKAEVAREIFEELLKEASLRFDGFRNTIIFPLDYYNELKKKYTEGE